MHPYYGGSWEAEVQILKRIGLLFRPFPKARRLIGFSWVIFQFTAQKSRKTIIRITNQSTEILAASTTGVLNRRTEMPQIEVCERFRAMT